MMLANDYQALKNIQTRVKQPTHAVNMHENDSLMPCNNTIILNDYTSAYYEDKNDGFEMLFRKFIDDSVENFDHPDLIK